MWHIETSGRQKTYCNLDLLLDESPEIYPILSAGLHGNAVNNTGFGFTVFYEATSKLTAVVKTDDKIYETSLTLQDVLNTTVQSFSVSWTPKSLLLYKDGIEESKSTGKAWKSYGNESVVSQEYILLFGHYYHSVSHTGVELLNVRIRRNALSSADLVASEKIKCKFLVSFQRTLLFVWKKSVDLGDPLLFVLRISQNWWEIQLPEILIPEILLVSILQDNWFVATKSIRSLSTSLICQLIILCDDQSVKSWPN